MRQIGVHLLQSNAEFDIEYTYLVDETLIQNGQIIRGSFVDVPFGHRKRPETGVVWRVGDAYEPEDGGKARFKTIAGVSAVRPPLEAYEMTLAEKMKSMYFCSLGACVRCMVPPPAPKGRALKYARLCVPPETVRAAAASGALRNIRQIRILEELEAGSRPVSELAKNAGCGAGVLDTLAKRGYIRIETRTPPPEEALKDRKKLSRQSFPLPTYDRHVLNEEQQKAYDDILELMRKNRFAECLVHGITGSGKTELYLQLISETIASGGDALLLVPEISLTPQMTAHFRRRFGENVAVLHSRMSDGERNLQWNKIKNGAVSVAVGARSAIFAPFRRLRLIILDEEHEPSYYSEDAAPHYHAAEIAETIGRIRNAVVLYGSATPRVETYYRAVRHEIHCVRLTKRANRAALPEMILEDLREARETGTADYFSVFGEKLKHALGETYRSGKQAMLFVHRRGYAKQMLCRSCGSIMKCARCSVPMTYHEHGNRLICHYCGRTAPAPAVCPRCGSADFERHGTGTQKVVEELRKLFPDAAVLRMDTDTTSGRDGCEKILSSFAAGEAPFLVGTQMIAKGHDFPNVTLVGIISADSLINMPDYKAEERAFQLFSQMAGRAGRGSSAGKVIIQAYQTDDYAITAACRHDYAEFYANEITVRRNLHYPPFCAMCVLRFSGEEDRATYETAAAACGKMRDAGVPDVEILGPARAEQPKLNNKYRWVITLKSKCRTTLTEFLAHWTEDGKMLKKIRGRANLSIRFDGR